MIFLRLALSYVMLMQVGIFMPGPAVPQPSGGANTFTNKQITHPFVGTNCSTTCTGTITSTTAGSNVSFMLQNSGNGIYPTTIWACSGAGPCSSGDSLTIPAGCQDGNANGSTACAYNLSVAAGDTAITVTMASAPSGGIYATFWEYAHTPGPAVLDGVCGALKTPAAGVTVCSPTVTGTKDVDTANTWGLTGTGVNSPFGNYQGTAAGGYAADNENTASPSTSAVFTYSLSFGAIPTSQMAIK